MGTGMGAENLKAGWECFHTGISPWYLCHTEEPTTASSILKLPPIRSWERKDDGMAVLSPQRSAGASLPTDGETRAQSTKRICSVLPADKATWRGSPQFPAVLSHAQARAQSSPHHNQTGRRDISAELHSDTFLCAWCLSCPRQ